jgi:hypothetical protein
VFTLPRVDTRLFEPSGLSPLKRELQQVFGE